MNKIIKKYQLVQTAVDQFWFIIYLLNTSKKQKITRWNCNFLQFQNSKHDLTQYTLYWKTNCRTLSLAFQLLSLTSRISPMKKNHQKLKVPRVRLSSNWSSSMLAATRFSRSERAQACRQRELLINERQV